MLGANMSGGNPKGKRRKDDYYPTPPGTTRAILPVLREHRFPRDVWECACGDGRMSQELRADGYNVISTDINPRRYGTRLDFLATRAPQAQAIVTNPPFSLADAFIAHALGVLGVQRMALILPMNFWCAASRGLIFDQWPPSHVLPMTWRIDNTGEGRPTMTSMWCVWSPLRMAGGNSARFSPLVSSERTPGRMR